MIYEIQKSRKPKLLNIRIWSSLKPFHNPVSYKSTSLTILYVLLIHIYYCCESLIKPFSVPMGVVQFTLLTFLRPPLPHLCLWVIMTERWHRFGDILHIFFSGCHYFTPVYCVRLRLEEAQVTCQAVTHPESHSHCSTSPPAIRNEVWLESCTHSELEPIDCV